MDSNCKKTETHFLNVDLRVSAPASKLKELIDAFAPALFALGTDEFQDCAVFEVDGKVALSVDETILAFYKAVQELPESARGAWESAGSRCFDIGIQGGDHPHEVCYRLSTEAITRLSSMKADVAVTVYAPRKG